MRTFMFGLPSAASAGRSRRAYPSGPVRFIAPFPPGARSNVIQSTH